MQGFDTPWNIASIDDGSGATHLKNDSVQRMPTAGIALQEATGDNVFIIASGSAAKRVCSDGLVAP